MELTFGGVRGKYYKAYRAGHTVKIHHTNGTIEEQVFPAEEGVVILSEDVREFFPDSETVNNTLRTLISLIPEKHEVSVEPH